MGLLGCELVVMLLWVGGAAYVICVDVNESFESLSIY